MLAQFATSSALSHQAGPCRGSLVIVLPSYPSMLTRMSRWNILVTSSL